MFESAKFLCKTGNMWECLKQHSFVRMTLLWFNVIVKSMNSQTGVT